MGCSDRFEVSRCCHITLTSMGRKFCLNEPEFGVYCGLHKQDTLRKEDIEETLEQIKNKDALHKFLNET